LFLFLSPQVGADEFSAERRILKVDLTVSGEESWKTKASWEKGKLSQRYYFATVVKPLQELSTVNPLDPHYAADQIAKGQQAQAKIARTQDNLRKKGIATGPAPMSQQDLMAMAQKIMETCKGDEACQQREGMKLMAQMKGGVQMPQGAPSANAGGDEEDEAEEEARFQHWFGYDGCPTKILATINDRAEGGLADVSGVVPTSRIATASFTGNDVNRSMQCLNYQSVVDVKAKAFYSHGFLFPIVRGSSEYKEGGRILTASADGELAALPSDVATWAAEILKKAPLSGSKSAKLKLTDPSIVSPIGGAIYEGTVDVKLTWSFTQTLPAGAGAAQLPEK
jgi:hypothetical protein